MPDAPPADLAGLRWELIRLGGSVDNRRFTPRMRELLPAIIASLIELEHTRRQSENGRPTMPDETTTRDRIRAVIEGYAVFRMEDGETISSDDLAERIDRDLFGDDDNVSEVQHLREHAWYGNNERRALGELEALKAEVRRLDYVAVDGQHWDNRRAAALARTGFPHIAAILREPQE